MIEVVQSETFARWLGKLKDRAAAMRINYGPGYRLYFIQSGPVLVVLLAGGNKSTQDADIKRAIEIAKEWKP